MPGYMGAETRPWVASGEPAFVLRRLYHLFRRYAAQHQQVRLPAFPLLNEDGVQTGQVEVLQIHHGRLFVEGWTFAEHVALVSPSGRSETRPHMLRPDVVKTGAMADANLGFRLDAPLDPEGMSLCTTTGQARYIHALPEPRAARLSVGYWWLLVPFSIALMRAVPAVLRWRKTGDPVARARVKALLGLTGGQISTAVLPERLFAEPGTPASGPGPAITLIVPVHNAFDLLAEMLDRIERHTDLPWHLVLIEDSSTDTRVRPYLRDWVAARETHEAGRVTLIETPENLGFIGSVNQGFEVALARGDHVVLLNSDAFVPAGWASRLLAPIMADATVASVTPMSNDAEILTVPQIGQKTALRPGLADLVDRTAARLDPEAGSADLPTGIGFCMAIGIDFLRKEPRFDISFGRGYGEEVDWCQKIRAQGGRHLATAALFVEHRGGASFGSEEKHRRVARNNAIIADRYPGYDADVQAFIRTDPLAPQRLALAIAMAAGAQDGPVPIYLAHSLGGGAESDLQRRIGEVQDRGGAAIVLRVGGARRWQVELCWNGRVQAAGSDDFALLETLLHPVETRRIVYSCGVGDRDPIEIPDRLLTLKRGEEDRLEVLFHDFFPVSPSYTLLDGAGVFSGVPEADSPDPVHNARRPGGKTVPLAAWRAAWGRLIEAADEVVVFSRDSGAHVQAAFAQAKPVLRPHPLLVEVPRVTPPRSGRQVIGVLGNIGYHKGAVVVVDLARALERQGRTGLVLIGTMAPDFALPASAHQHGAYRVGEIPALVARYGITDWLIPSIWPETFSFTTHEALATGLPVWCFDLGAQAEAARAAPNGHVLPLTADGDLTQVVLAHITGSDPGSNE